METNPIDLLTRAMKACAAAHGVEFADWTAEAQVALKSETVPVVSDVNTICRAVFGNSAMVSVEFGYTNVFLDEYEPLEKPDMELLMSALPYGTELFSSEVAPEEAEGAGETIDDFLGVDSEKYGIAFDRASGYLRDVVMKMGQQVGWKHHSVPFDFDGFSGYYPEVYPDHADICQGDEVVARFSSDEEGRLVFEDFGLGYDKDVNPWYPLSDIMNGRFCLEPDNISRAVSEFHEGHILVYGMRFGEACAFGIRPEDGNLRSKLSDREVNVRFVDQDALIDSYVKWVKKNSLPGYEQKVLPQLVIYGYDGQSLKTEREICLNVNRAGIKGWEKDWEMIDVLRSKGEAIRTELERAAGVPSGTHFKFENVLIPTTTFRDDVLFLTSKFGFPGNDFLTVVNGNVTLYRDYPKWEANMGKAEPRRVFDSIDSAMKAVRSVCFSEKNIELARQEYRNFLSKTLKI